MNTARKHFLCLFKFAFLLLGLWLENGARAQAPPQDKSTDSASTVRPCIARGESPKAAARKDKAKKKADGSLEGAAISCIEAKDSALNIQEFVQSYARAQTWQFGEEEFVADGFMFVRYLDKESLLQFAKEGSFAGHVTWTGGKAVVLLSTRALNEGYTRAEVTVHIQGFGENVDRFAPARDSWDLDSTGLLEKTLIAALEDHFQSLH